MAYTSFFDVAISRLKNILKNNGNPGKKIEIANKEIYLPLDVLVLILSRLSIKENILASAVCKTWHEAATSVRDRSPWLLYFDIGVSGVCYGFFDPVEKKKTEAIKLPDLSIYARICYSKNGWLLMEDYHEDTKILFFFNPFTQENIKLPNLIANGTIGMNFCFSCAPTDTTCVVCAISNRAQYHFRIHTWHLGAVEWVTYEFSRSVHEDFFGKKYIVFSDGCFWFSDRSGLGVFDPVEHTWRNLQVPLGNLSPFHKYITEYKGNIIMVDVLSNVTGQLVVYRLNKSRLVWERRQMLDGFSIFISEKSSMVTNGLKGDMNNMVYVWDPRLIKDGPSKYSLYTKRFCADSDGYCVESSTNNKVLRYGAWIEPPHKTVQSMTFPL